MVSNRGINIILFSDDQMKRMEETLKIINDQSSKSLKRKNDPKKVSNQYLVIFLYELL